MFSLFLAHLEGSKPIGALSYLYQNHAEPYTGFFLFLY